MEELELIVFQISVAIFQILSCFVRFSIAVYLKKKFMLQHRSAAAGQSIAQDMCEREKVLKVNIYRHRRRKTEPSRATAYLSVFFPWLKTVYLK
jgi:hypothetical protein